MQWGNQAGVSTDPAETGAGRQLAFQYRSTIGEDAWAGSIGA